MKFANEIVPLVELFVLFGYLLHLQIVFAGHGKTIKCQLVKSCGHRLDIKVSILPVIQHVSQQYFLEFSF